MALFRPALGRVLFAALLAALAATMPAQGSSGSATVTRPTAPIVKKLLAKKWDLDRESSVGEVTLTFRSLRLLTTRTATPTDFVEGKWVTPVASVLDQRIVTLSPNILSGGTDRYCLLCRVTFTGIVWKGDFGWMAKNRDVTTKRISNTC